MAGTALVLSGGGMFGAYQAGAWLALEEILRPDIVIGASVGSLNGWAIASGMPASRLVEMWRDPTRAARHPLQFPRSLRSGFIESSLLESWIRQLHASGTPRTRVGVALTEMWALQPVLVEDAAITWQHLAASCAVPGFLPQYRIGSACYADGGLLGPLPLWAALKMGADRIVAINVLPPPGPFLLRWGASLLQRIANVSHPVPDIPLVAISPSPRLGPASATVRWDPARIEAWIERGRADALAKKHLLYDMF